MEWGKTSWTASVLILLALGGYGIVMSILGIRRGMYLGRIELSRDQHPVLVWCGNIAQLVGCVVVVIAAISMLRGQR